MLGSCVLKGWINCFVWRFFFISGFMFNVMLCLWRVVFWVR